MSSKKYLSSKKTAKQTISISPALKEWIERYVNVNRKKNSKDERFNSISAFYNYVMEKTMEIFKKGKTLDDFERFVDSEVEDLLDKISFKAMIPTFETIVETSRYSTNFLRKNIQILLVMRKFYLDNTDSQDIKSYEFIFDRIRNRYLSNKITKELKLNLLKKKDTGNYLGFIEFAGFYKNLFCEYCKGIAAVVGILGIKITDYLYSEDNIYSKFNIETTDLFFKKELVKEERIKLIKQNMEYLTNYNMIVNDKDYYLWMKMAEDKNLLITYNNEKFILNWLNLIEADSKKYGTKENLLLNLLKLFEKLHWIAIESQKELAFQLRLTKEKFNLERKFLMDYLSRHSKLSEINGTFYLE